MWHLLSTLRIVIIEDTRKYNARLLHGRKSRPTVLNEIALFIHNWLPRQQPSRACARGTRTRGSRSTVASWSRDWARSWPSPRTTPWARTGPRCACTCGSRRAASRWRKHAWWRTSSWDSGDNGRGAIAIWTNWTGVEAPIFVPYKHTAFHAKLGTFLNHRVHVERFRAPSLRVHVSWLSTSLTYSVLVENVYSYYLTGHDRSARESVRRGCLGERVCVCVCFWTSILPRTQWSWRRGWYRLPRFSSQKPYSLWCWVPSLLKSMR